MAKPSTNKNLGHLLDDVASFWQGPIISEIARKIINRCIELHHASMPYQIIYASYTYIYIYVYILYVYDVCIDIYMYIIYFICVCVFLHMHVYETFCK